MDDDLKPPAPHPAPPSAAGSSPTLPSPTPPPPPPPTRRPTLSRLHAALSILLLFLNFFLAQYDKFVLSYFQAQVVASLRLSSSQYGVLSGYATGIVYALLAIPIAFVADYTQARVWVLSLATLWWSLCVVFQGLSGNFWQILLARIAMGVGQAPAEALSVSLISDMVGLEMAFFAEGVLYVGVYVGEAVSAQIATAFDKTGTPWNSALKAIGIAGIVIGILLRLVLREPPRRTIVTLDEDPSRPVTTRPATYSRLESAKAQFLVSLNYIVRLRSFWLLTLSSGARQFSGNIFGYYMPSYLSSIYPSNPDILSRYGIIVGAVGSVAVLLGGIISAYGSRKGIIAMPLYITSIGGAISSVFVVLMVESVDIAGGDQDRGAAILYGVMSVAYITAELWLGAFAFLLALLLPPRMKTFGLAIYMSVIVLIYSAGPQIIGLALRNEDVASVGYINTTKILLAVLIPVGYWLACVGFLLAIPLVRRDLAGDIVPKGQMSSTRKRAFGGFIGVLAALVIGLFVSSLTVVSS